jgi:hypothetical protein
MCLIKFSFFMNLYFSMAFAMWKCIYACQLPNTYVKDWNVQVKNSKYTKKTEFSNLK